MMAQKQMQVVPIETRFDFLEGAFSRSEKTRWTMLGLSLLTAIVLLVLAFQGIQASLAAQAAETSRETAQQNLAESTTTLAELDTFDGFSATQLREHVSTRRMAASGAAKGEIKLAELFSEIAAAAPPGMTINSIDVKSAGTDPAVVTPAEPGTETPVQVNALPSITIVATATAFGQIGVFQQNLEQIPGLGTITLTWGGGGESWSVTVTTTATDAAKSQRSIEFSRPSGSTTTPTEVVPNG